MELKMKCFILVQVVQIGQRRALYAIFVSSRVFEVSGTALKQCQKKIADCIYISEKLIPNL